MSSCFSSLSAIIDIKRWLLASLARKSLFVLWNWHQLLYVIWNFIDDLCYLLWIDHYLTNQTPKYTNNIVGDVSYVLKENISKEIARHLRYSIWTVNFDIILYSLYFSSLYFSSDKLAYPPSLQGMVNHYP